MICQALQITHRLCVHMYSSHLFSMCENEILFLVEQCVLFAKRTQSAKRHIFFYPVLQI